MQLFTLRHSSIPIAPAMLDGESAETVYQALHSQHPVDLFRLLMCLSAGVGKGPTNSSIGNQYQILKGAGFYSHIVYIEYVNNLSLLYTTTIYIYILYINKYMVYINMKIAHVRYSVIK